MEQLTVLEILRKASDWMQDPDHYTRHTRFDGIRTCALGAIEYALGGNEDTFHQDMPEYRAESVPDVLARLASVIRGVNQDHLDKCTNANTIVNHSNEEGHSAIAEAFRKAVKAEEEALAVQ